MPFVPRGAGGMAKAVATALRDAGHRRGTIVARNEAKGRALADLYGFDWSKTAEGLTAPLPINATLGMAGPDVQTPAFNSIAIAAADIIFDVVALPVETPLMRAALRLGRRRISGREVALLQALEQFVLYTGIRPDVALVEDAAAFARAT
jgi:shikimate dehydrogenase